MADQAPIVGTPELQIVYRAPAELRPDPRNSRTHDPAQLAMIDASMGEFGFTNPVLIDEFDQIIAGHGRQVVALRRGMLAIPTITLAHLTDAQRRAYVIADNAIPLHAGWDEAMLASEMRALAALEFDLGALGFTDTELAKLMAEATGGKDDDDAGGDDAGSDAGSEPGAGSLADRFMLPPFSVLNAREGWWQARKRAWLALGIRSEEGRGGTGTNGSHGPTVTQNADGTLAYRGAAREAWDQAAPAPARKAAARKKAPNASPGGSPRPAADYSKRKRGTGAGGAIDG